MLKWTKRILRTLLFGWIYPIFLIAAWLFEEDEILINFKKDIWR